MVSSGIAILWQFQRRHIVAFLSSILSLVFSALMVQLLPDGSLNRYSATALCTLPLLHLAYMIAIFGFGCDTDLFAGASSYPTHMLKLPLSTFALVTWPLLIGSATMLLFWLAIRSWVLSPIASAGVLRDAIGSLDMAPLLCVATLAVLQATLWTDYRRAVSRAVMTSAALIAPWVLLVIASRRGLPVTTRGVGLLILAAAAYGLSIRNLARTRCGMVTDWFPSRIMSLMGQQASWSWTRCRQFRTNMGAQIWYEWKCNFLPILTFITAAVSFSWVFSLYYPQGFFRACMLIAPVMIAFFGSLGVGSLSSTTNSRNLSAFFAGRPFSSSRFVSAKWIAAAITAGTACGLAVAASILTMWIHGDMVAAREWFDAARQTRTIGQIVVWVGGMLALYPLVTWVLLVQALPIRLSGRYWLESFLILMFVGMGCFFGFGMNADQPALRPWTLGILISCKAVLATYTLRRLLKQQLVRPSILVGWLACWLAVVLGSVAVVASAQTALSTRNLLELAGAFVVFWPINRIALAPLALEANRHN